MRPGSSPRGHHGQAFGFLAVGCALQNAYLLLSVSNGPRHKCLTTGCLWCGMALTASARDSAHLPKDKPDQLPVYLFIKASIL